MKEVVSLDCTLRDGGYYTNWNFKLEMVQKLVYTLNSARVNIIELGYKSPLKGGKFRKCNDKYIWSLLNNQLPSYSSLAFMIDAKDFLFNENLDFKLLDDCISPSSESPFSICRIAIKWNEIKYAKILTEAVTKKGYKVIINLMGISSLDDNRLKNFITSFTKSKIKPLALYFADSFGNLLPEKIAYLTNKLKSEIDCEIGIHAHDNLGLAFANTLVSIENGATFIDSTILGMGRGAGNLKTEQLLTFLEFRGLDYNSNYFQIFNDNFIYDLKENYRWGFSQNYMISGLNSIHPSYNQLLASSFLDSQSVSKILHSLKSPEKFDLTDIHSHLVPKVSIVIPARYKSSRFPGKPLAKINGKEMVIRVAEIAEKVIDKRNIYIATENHEIVEVSKSYGFKVILTSDECLTGTDRVAEASYELDSDIILNIQGDEPMINPSDIKRVIEEKIRNFNSVINCYAYLDSTEDVNDKKIPKVITSISNELIYCSRNPIPGFKSIKTKREKKQVCIYAFNKKELQRFNSVQEKTPLEYEEDIEIIRFLELGIKVKMIELSSVSYAVDYEDDIKTVEKLLDNSK
jgi:3-deoxy-manno-octulosonate cytidylyltransferase (CMP-KDO synthetase)